MPLRRRRRPSSPDANDLLGSLLDAREGRHTSNHRIDPSLHRNCIECLRHSAFKKVGSGEQAAAYLSGTTPIPIEDLRFKGERRTFCGTSAIYNRYQESVHGPEPTVQAASGARLRSLQESSPPANRLRNPGPHGAPLEHKSLGVSIPPKKETEHIAFCIRSPKRISLYAWRMPQLHLRTAKQGVWPLPLHFMKSGGLDTRMNACRRPVSLVFLLGDGTRLFGASRAHRRQPGSVDGNA